MSSDNNSKAVKLQQTWTAEGTAHIHRPSHSIAPGYMFLHRAHSLQDRSCVKPQGLLNSFKKAAITSRFYYFYSRIKPEFNKEGNWKIHNYVKMKQPAPEQVVQRGTKKQYLETKKIKIPYKSLQYTAKTVLRGKFIELNIIGRQREDRGNQPNFTHQDTRGEKQIKSKVS